MWDQTFVNRSGGLQLTSDQTVSGRWDYSRSCWSFKGWGSDLGWSRRPLTEA